MGNNASSEQAERLHGVENIKNFELSEKDVNHHHHHQLAMSNGLVGGRPSRKPAFFSSLRLKIAETTTRKGKSNKNSKVKPSGSGDELKRCQQQHEPFSITSKSEKLKLQEPRKQQIYYINENLKPQAVDVACRPKTIERYLDVTETKEDRVKPPLPQAVKPRKIVIQASTTELLRCLGEFICRRCRLADDLRPGEVGTWLREVDRSLIAQGWQELRFIMPSSVVFVYMLCRECVPKAARSRHEVQVHVLTCLYLAYSYMGNEISYPLRPFLREQSDRGAFWERCCQIMSRMSGKMLRVNSETHFFTSLFRELTTYGTPSTHEPPSSVDHRIGTAA